MSYLKTFTHKQQIFGSPSTTSPSKKSASTSFSANPKDLKQAKEDAEEDYIEVSNIFSFILSLYLDISFSLHHRLHLKD
jgi:hypothetical protein